MAMCSYVAKADNVSVDEGKQVAASFMCSYLGQEGGLTAADVELVYQIDNEQLGVPASYFFNVGKEGWVILAATTTIDPIIAFSAEDRLDPEELPENMMWFVKAYSENVCNIQALDEAEDWPDDPTWTDLVNGKYKGASKAEQHVLTYERWGQGSEVSPTYNYYCPVASDGRTAVVGCVATAMAQIMHYFSYPVQPQGHPYYWLTSSSTDTTMPNVMLEIQFDTVAPFNYAIMPNSPTNVANQMTCTEEQMKEVARLSYYAGITVKMGYSPDGSGTQSTKVPNAMQRYFKYQPSNLIYRNEPFNSNDRTFINGLRANLINKIILYMSGASSTNGGRDAAGHAWVCAGYQETDTNKYYMNWGWNGSGNGFYNLGLNSMRPSGTSYNFNVRLDYIDGLVPPADSSILSITSVDLDATTLGTAYPNPAMVSVTVPYSTDRASELTVYSIEGKPVATYRVQPGSGEVKVDVAGMPTGIYIYRMNSQHGKFIVQ
ncbi:MAG: thiol protease/hemagglutinin PrtT [Bacteroidales bacterium]|nr:thiol protease/hemagglutinin PrtT [Bacteroidales bacterium]